MERKQISFRIEDIIISWLRKREKETGKNTSDFLREVIWAVYHQDLQQKVSQEVSDKYYERELKSLEKDIGNITQYASTPEGRRQLAQMLLSAKLALERSGLAESLMSSPKHLKRDERTRGKPENHKHRVRKNAGIKRLEKPRD